MKCQAGPWVALVVMFLAALGFGSGSLAGGQESSSSPPANPADGLSAIEFVTIPAGEFLMGCGPRDEPCDSRETPQHRVRITREFQIGKYEVTRAQWITLMGKSRNISKSDNRPAHPVSWNDIQEFLQTLNARHDGFLYRLPTEAEWEYAAVAGNPDKSANVVDSAWYSGNNWFGMHQVGLKQPNGWGLYDMLGNAWEWVQDWYAEYAPAAPAGSLAIDPQGPATGTTKVLRGGSYSDSSTYLRTFRRFNFNPAAKTDSFGFRCVRVQR
jgi:formylglycine-generating enzyme required for sulfatase activity